MSDIQDRALEVGHSAGDVGNAVRNAGIDVTRTAHEAGTDVARTAKEEAREVAHAATDQAKQVGTGIRQRVRQEVDRQHHQVVDRIGAFAGELSTMAAERPDTPAGELVGMLAAQSRSFADYLGQHGPDRVLDELQDFARRRPGTFIIAAVAAGFAVGRLGKGVWQNQHEDPSS